MDFQITTKGRHSPLERAKLPRPWHTLAATVLLLLALSGCASSPLLTGGEGQRPQNRLVSPLNPLSPLGAEPKLKYVLYVGLNDKDNYTQLISNEEALRKVSKIALAYVDGFTVSLAKGAYKDDKGITTFENSLVMDFLSASEEDIYGIADRIRQELNQNSVLIQKQAVNFEFYEGKRHDKN